ncbi:prepilin-type N-terminal cleavage/methylation domain-containing protein [Paenibacillus kobensis]|uniref:prepilin-type N-terminal cleavage/methylation domain-containing protein n=1 Tax=Paenibacillus kobensis TaxID=59841 RepID=UPI000FDA02A2|nr:prepilin-type N-terminal cleavage/methylation domain-containing protein [Paenibacillus kobensis]
MLPQWMNRCIKKTRQGDGAASFTTIRKTNAGLTLVEVLATIVLISVAFTAVFFVINQTHNGVKQITSREQMMDESRTIINHIVQASRRESAVVTADPARSLDLKYESGGQVAYSYDAAKHELSYTSTVNGETRSGVLSAHVGSVSFTPDRAGRRIDISLTMTTPGGGTYVASTVVNLPSL